MKNLKSLNNKLVLKLEKIDTKELAYIIGFICADCSINEKHWVEFDVKLEDKELLDFMSKILQCTVHTDNTFIKEKRRFPRARMVKTIKDITLFTGNCKKKGRNLPIISRQLNKYMVLGFFDADGCLTWGRRKDRNRIWQKISFTSSLSLLTSLQQILIKEVNISTILRPKSNNEDCYVLEFANKENVLKFCKWIYSDSNFLVLKRKFNNYNALRLELGEFNETTNSTTLSSAVDLSTECAETSGELNGVLNNHSSTQDSIELRHSPNRGH